MNIGKIIRKKRRDLDFSQATLAKKIGVNKGAVWSWEKDIDFPKGRYLLCLMYVLDLNRDDFPCPQ